METTEIYIMIALGFAAQLKCSLSNPLFFASHLPRHFAGSDGRAMAVKLGLAKPEVGKIAAPVTNSP